MLAFIGGLFAGVFGILGNLLGKKSDYLLEFKDDQGTNESKEESTQGSVAAPEPTTKKETKPASPEIPKPETPKIAKKAEAENGTPAVATPQPPVTNVKVSQEPEELLLFAPNFLMPKPTAKRRRPGPSMDMFRGMAKDLNLPR
ncbi:MAG: hypothetical protein F6K18_02660 [Okeania sp. SIO2C2]|uniref:hypothetical protein n=1 Tax=unclassified Okeania TaxID=2634635 RepID=UPI0013BD4602|nr:MULTISPECIES: hypothetical protein [unclassified Okeania]NEP08181.1 hypothetical protein [Okeania sp. SIO4D6]NEP40046.1 hypothetical protein [Okeania sp. SIO2H7]NEP74997.1 hypothetical protein [Okeania sp. SIO2G5]NEP85809.1 hypothetical protein [Okeania sp. SIO2C2]NEP94527.1 hypothetical protein [Okeania sp. SIO2F5]